MHPPPGVDWPDDLPPLPEKAARYLGEAVEVVKTRADLTSVVVFGSLTRGSWSDEVSDVDVILVLGDATTSRTMRHLRRDLTKLEFQHSFRGHTRSVIDLIYRFSSSITGMFVSHFACRRSDLLDARFARVFNVNRLLCFFFAPHRIVWGSILSSARVIHGDQRLLEKVERPPITSWQLHKSRIMNQLLCLAALVSSPFHRNATMFAMESLKWTIHACHYCCTRSTTDLAAEISYFSSKPGFDAHSALLERLLELRNHYQQDARFIRSTLRSLSRFHRLALEQITFPIPKPP